MKIKILILAGLAFLASMFPCKAQISPPPYGYRLWSVGQNTTGYTFGTTNFLVVSSSYAGNPQQPNVVPIVANLGTPFCTYLQATSDLATAQITIWQSAGAANTNVNATAFTFANGVSATNSTTSLFLSTTNGIAVGAPIVVKHVPSDFYDIRSVASITQVFSTNVSGVYPFATNVTSTFTVVVNAAPTYSVNPQQDTVFGYTSGPQIPIAAQSLTLGPAGQIFAGQYGVPLLMSVNFTTVGKINIASGGWQ